MKTEIDFNAKESEILQLIADGFTLLEIAAMLFITEETVESYCRRMIKKAGAKNTADLVRITSKAGLLNEFPVELKKYHSANCDQNADNFMVTAHKNTIQRVFKSALPVMKHIFSPGDTMKRVMILCMALVVCYMSPAATSGKERKIKSSTNVNAAVEAFPEKGTASRSARMHVSSSTIRCSPRKPYASAPRDSRSIGSGLSLHCCPGWSGCKS